MTLPKAFVETLFVDALGKEDSVRGRVQIANIGMWPPRSINIRKYPGQG